MEMRQNKRYLLKASVTLTWERTDGSTMRGEGYTRDISVAGVFVLTSSRLVPGTAVKLEVKLPALSKKRGGASLWTHGQVVRSEEIGFAATADMGFQMQFPERLSSADTLPKRDGNGMFEAGSNGNSARKIEPVFLFWM